MSSKKSKDFVDNVDRRSWDLAEYERRAQEKRLEAEREAYEAQRASRGTLVVKAPLQARDTKLHLDKNVGKQLVVTGSSSRAEQGGFYCEVCECSLKDSLAWLSHINGRKHHAKQGISMLTEQATIDDVRKQLKMIKDKKHDEQKQQRDITHLQQSYQEKRRLAKHDHQRSRYRSRSRSRSRSMSRSDDDHHHHHREKRKKHKSKKHKSKKHKSKKHKKHDRRHDTTAASADAAAHAADDDDTGNATVTSATQDISEMQKLMGFGSFGSSKK
jgi:U4/U6.U5 tri-snRNP component SNU23